MTDDLKARIQASLDAPPTPTDVRLDEMRAAIAALDIEDLRMGVMLQLLEIQRLKELLCRPTSA